ncbi:hypothetical protein GQ600_3101 [Phytophthora cactorum]|nr:hypothetical protein GQ600_3101 [Phytophthora cactorum]
MSSAGGPTSSSRSARSFRVQRRSTTAAAVAIAAPRSIVTTVVAAPVAPAIMTPLPPHLLSSIDRINAALEVAVAQPPQATGTLRVCQATEDEWNAFVDSDEHIVRPNFLEWFADTGEIHIIEFADAPHGNYVCEFVSVFICRATCQFMAQRIHGRQEFSGATMVSRPQLWTTPNNTGIRASSRRSNI